MTNRNGGTSSYTEKTCAVVFIIFCFVYIFFYQSDVLAAAQHVASGGKTRYTPLLGAILITIALKLLQSGIQTVFKLKNKWYWLGYFPSFLILAACTNMPATIEPNYSFEPWLWLLPLLLIVWLAVAILVKRGQGELSYRGKEGLFSRKTGMNLFLFLIMMLSTCLIGNKNRTFHEQMHVESLISRSEYSDACKAADKFMMGNHNIVVLRAFALAHEGNIGADLFNCEMVGVNSIKPNQVNISTLIVNKGKMYAEYKRNADWQLCELLVNKNINAFHDKLISFYGLQDFTPNTQSDDKNSTGTKADGDSKKSADSLLRVSYSKLPEHYKEALSLYAKLHHIARYNSIDEENAKKFLDFMASDMSRRQKVYGKTYWYFYYTKIK